MTAFTIPTREEVTSNVMPNSTISKAALQVVCKRWGIEYTTRTTKGELIDRLITYYRARHAKYGNNPTTAQARAIRKFTKRFAFSFHP